MTSRSGEKRSVPDLDRWSRETPEVRNEIAWCYAELDRLSSVCETQEKLLIEQIEKIDEQDRELARSVLVAQEWKVKAERELVHLGERLDKEREMLDFISDANSAIDFASETFRSLGMRAELEKLMELFTQHDRYETTEKRPDERS